MTPAGWAGVAAAIAAALVGAYQLGRVAGWLLAELLAEADPCRPPPDSPHARRGTRQRPGSAPRSAGTGPHTGGSAPA